MRALPVSAPFHCRLMQPAEDRFAPHLHGVALSDPHVPVYVNVDASAVTTAAAARDALVRQISRPVRWEQSIRKMLEDDRRRAGWSVGQAAWRLGITVQEYREIVDGERWPDGETWDRMCKLYGWPQTFVGSDA